MGAALSVALIGVAAALTARIVGPSWGWMVFSGGLLALGCHHLANVARLVEWTRAPVGTLPPSAAGPWGHVFSALYRVARAAADQRIELSLTLKRVTEAAQAMPDGVVILNAQDGIEWFNLAASRHLGLDASRDTGFAITNLVREPEFVSYLQAGEFAEPLNLKRAHGGGQVLAVQIVPFSTSRKLVLSRDITHMERLETVRRDFIANVSHELKTPLSVVSGFIETLREHWPSLTSEEIDRFLALAAEQSVRMERLVEDLLTLSRLETDTVAPGGEPVDVRGLIAAVGRDAQALSDGRHRVEIDAGEGDQLLGSESELRSAFVNLASNAVRYTPAGGRIIVRWRRALDGGGIFSVEDTGIGIAAQHVPRLTERFYRVDRGRSRETGGTGLGLAIVKHVLTRHDARLEIESELGKGSVFRARFPPKRVLTPQAVRIAGLQS